MWVRGAAGGAGTALVALATAGLGTLPFALRRARARSRAHPGGGASGWPWGLLWVLGVVNAANVWFYFRAIAEGAVAPAALTHYLAPVMVALAAPRFLSEAPGRRTPLALGLAFAGTALLLWSGAADGAAGSDGARARHAAIFGASSAVFYAACVLLGKRLILRLSEVEVFSVHSLLSAIVLVPLVELPAPGALLRPIAGGLVSSLVAGLAYYHGLRRIPAERAGVLCYLEVVAGVLVGWIGYSESPGLFAILGGLGILAAGIIVVTAPR
jgi:drug/metabolite transporter (DMT)-like permease